MFASEIGSPVWVLYAIHLSGLAITVLARRSEGTRQQNSLQWIALLALFVTGTGTLASMMLGPKCWMTCGAAFSLMVVLATVEMPGGDRNEMAPSAAGL